MLAALKVPVPLYYQLKQQMMDYINTAKLKEGELVPPEEELCSLFNVSRPTIRQAFSELAHEGYLNRVKAKGTFITHPKIARNFIQNIESFQQEMSNKGLVPTTKLLSIAEISVYPEILMKLRLQKDSHVIQIERLRYANNQPIVYVKTFLCAKRFKKIMKEDLEHDSLYEILDRKFNIRASTVNRSILAVAADSYIAQLLEVEEQSPLLYVSTIASDENSVPFEYSLASYRSDLYEMNIDLTRQE